MNGIMNEISKWFSSALRTDLFDFSKWEARGSSMKLKAKFWQFNAMLNAEMMVWGREFAAFEAENVRKKCAWKEVKKVINHCKLGGLKICIPNGFEATKLYCE